MAKTDYVAILNRRAEQYREATAAPEHKAMSLTDLRNKRNIEAWRRKWIKLIGREDTQ